MLGSFGQNDLDHKGVHIEEEDKKVMTDIGQCLYKVVDDHFTPTLKVLGSS